MSARAGELEVVVGDGVAVAIAGGPPLEDDLGPVGHSTLEWKDRLDRRIGRPGRGPLDPLLGDPYPPDARRFVGICERVRADTHTRKRQRRHLQVVPDFEPPEMCAIGQFALQKVPVPCWPIGSEEPVERAIDLLPRVAIPGEFEHRAGSLDLELPSHEDVGTGHRPDDLAGLSFLRHELALPLPDRLNGGGASPPGAPFEVGAVFPQAIAEPVRESRRPGSVILDRAGMPPAPDDRLARPKRHVQGTGGRVAVPCDPPFEHIDGRLPLIPAHRSLSRIPCV